MTVTQTDAVGTYHGPALVIHPENETFWRSLRAGELRLQRCTSCGVVRFPLGPLCHKCGSFEYSWDPMPPEGTVSAAVVIHRATGDQHWAEEVPFLTGLVDMAEGLRLPGRIFCDCGEAEKHGTPVTAGHLDMGEDYGVLCFTHSCRSDA
jgi:uncharacterized OB-fold protein